MIKKIKYILVLIAAAGIIISILVNNKSKLEAGVYIDKNGAHAVTVERIKYEKLSVDLTYTGTTEAANDVELISETSGKVEKVLAPNGEHINNGAVIAQVDNQITAANFKLAEAALDKAKLDYSRFEKLMKEGNLSANDLENSRIGLRNAEAQFILAKKYLSNTSIKSPINGILVNRYINIGSTLAPGTPVANIVDISELKIKISVPEKDLLKIKKGEHAHVTSPVYPGRIIPAKIKNISVKADESHNYTVELFINNARNELSAGMYVEVKFEFSTVKPVLTIARTSLTGSVKNPRVFVANSGKAYVKELLLGDEIGNRLVVLKGLEPGEHVVTEGQNNLSDGADIIIKNREL